MLPLLFSLATNSKSCRFTPLGFGVPRVAGHPLLSVNPATGHRAFDQSGQFVYGTFNGFAQGRCMICEEGHGCDPLPIPDFLIRWTQGNDPRCD